MICGLVHPFGTRGAMGLESLTSQILNEEPFTRPMSRDARKLRDDVYHLAFDNLKGRMNGAQFQSFVDNLKNEYEPLDWERAIFFQHHENVYKAILRVTSMKFREDTKNSEDTRAPWEKGTVAEGATRNKDIDWRWLIRFKDYERLYFMGEVFARRLSILPPDFDKRLDEFRPIYNMITRWVYSDFNYSALYRLWQMSAVHRPSFVQECMDKVEDQSKRTIEYLEAVIQGEYALWKLQVKDGQELEAESKLVYEAFKFMITKYENVDWDAVDKEADSQMNTANALNKVKMS